MRICIVYRDALQPGGYPRDVRWLSGALAGQGLDVHLIARQGASLDGLGTAQPVPFEDGRQVVEDADIIHLVGLLIPEQFRFLPTGDRGRLVISPLAQLMPEHLRRGRWKKLPYLAYVRARLRGHGPGYHLFSEQELSGVRRLMPHGPRFEAPLGLFPAPDAVGDRMIDEPYLLFFGRNDVRQKGIDRLLEGYAAAIGKGLSLPLVIAGAPHDDSAAFIARYLHGSSLGSRVRVLGSVDESEKWRLLRHAEALVFLSRWDGPPRPVREALAVGTPVIVSSGTNMGSLVDEAGAGAWVRSSRPDAVASALFAISPNRERWRQGVHKLRSRLDWDSVSLDFVRGYERVIAGWVRA